MHIAKVMYTVYIETFLVRDSGLCLEIAIAYSSTK